jgi:cardiolipin synthase
VEARNGTALAAHRRAMDAPTRETFVEMLVDGHRILPTLLSDLRGAQREILVAMFLFFRDPIGIEIARVLSERARAGVRVRVLSNRVKTAMGDPFSTGEKEMLDHDPAVSWNPLDTRPLWEMLEAAGAEVHDTDIDYDAHVPGLDDRLRSLAAQIRGGIDVDELHVDHRKIIVIDGRIGYVGGANIGAQYMSHDAFDPKIDAREEAEAWRRAGSPEPWWKWHDSQTRFEGPVVGSLGAYFRDRWILDGGTPFEVPAALPSSIAPSGIRVRSAEVFANEPSGSPNEIRALYLRRIATAERSIFIENPYLYHPDIVQALVLAKTARPSLDVVLVLPALAWNDNAFSQDAQQHCYAQLVERGIAVHEYQNHFTHLKLAVFDERWSIHGSTNLNHRSLEDDKDFELVVLVDGEELARDVLRRVRDRDLESCRRITEDDLHGSVEALRMSTRDPRTLLLLSRKVL